MELKFHKNETLVSQAGTAMELISILSTDCQPKPSPASFIKQYLLIFLLFQINYSIIHQSNKAVEKKVKR